MGRGRLRKTLIDGAWWAQDEHGQWMRWNSATSAWEIQAPPPGLAEPQPGPEPPPPTPPPAFRFPLRRPEDTAPADPLVPGWPGKPTHWAADPAQRTLFFIMAPVVIFVTGFLTMRNRGIPLPVFLASFPVVALGLTIAVYLIAKKAAEDQADGMTPPSAPRGRPPLPQSRAVFGGLVAALVAVPLAWGLLEGPGSLVLTLLVVLPAAGVLALLMFAEPRRGGFNPNWVLVPAGIVSGGAVALGWLVIEAFFAFPWWGGSEPSPLSAMAIFVVASMLGYLFWALNFAATSRRRGWAQRMPEGIALTALFALVVGVGIRWFLA